MYKLFLHTEEDDLSVRSNNIINDYGGIDNILKYYKEHKSFLKFRNVGKNTNIELCSYCENLLIKTPAPETLESAKTDNPIDLEKHLLIYEYEKEFLSVRAKNALKKFEDEAKYYSDDKNKFDLIKKLFLTDFNFYKLHNVGKVTIKELIVLKDIVQTGNINDIHRTYLAKKLRRIIGKGVMFHIDESEIKQLINNDQYSFARIFCICLLNSDKLRERTKQILLNLYFNETPLDRIEHSKIINCSPERIRQIGNDLIDKIIPLAAISAKNIVEESAYDIQFDSIKNLFSPDSFPPVYFRGFEYTPNTALTKIAIKNVLKKNYLLVDNLILDTHKSFIDSQQVLFVSKKFIESAAIQKALTWIDEQMYNFESIAHEYNLKVLIKRYYTENELTIEEHELNDVLTIVSKIKRESFELNESAIKKISKQNLADTVLDEVQVFLEEKAEAQTTKVILDHLANKNLGIEKYELLKALKQNRKTYCYFGNGNWALTKWKKTENTIGPFREMIRKQLSNNDDPVHISDIHFYINTMKNVSLHSIYSNLRMDKDSFTFFNCSFIGLSNKKYSEYWYTIKKFKPSQIRNFESKSQEEIDANIILFSKKFGYPEKHLRFILDCRKGKYGEQRERKVRKAAIEKIDWKILLSKKGQAQLLFVKEAIYQAKEMAVQNWLKSEYNNFENTGDKEEIRKTKLEIKRKIGNQIEPKLNGKSLFNLLLTGEGNDYEIFRSYIIAAKDEILQNKPEEQNHKVLINWMINY